MRLLAARQRGKERNLCAPSVSSVSLWLMPLTPATTTRQPYTVSLAITGRWSLARKGSGIDSAVTVTSFDT